MLNQTKYNAITVIQSSLTEQSVMVDCPAKEDKTAIAQSYSTDRADEILAEYTSQIDRLIPINHPNIQSIIDIFVEEDSLHLVTGAVQGKRAATTVPLSEERCEKLLKEILPVLTYLHEQDITHGNISPDTILFKAQNQPVLTDFQVITELKIAAGGEVYPPISQQLTELAVANIPSGQQFDLYSLGVTIIYLLSNRELKHLYDPTSQKWQWENHLRPSSGKLLRVIDRLLNSKSISAAEISQEFQIQSRVIMDAPIPIPDTRSNLPTQTLPTNTTNQTTTISQPPTNSQPIPTNIQPPREDKQHNLLIFGGLATLIALFMGISIGSNNNNQVPSQTSSIPSPVAPDLTESSPTPVLPPPNAPISSSPSPAAPNSTESSPTQVLPPPNDPNSPTLPPSQSIDLSENEAIDLISRWLTAKNSLFGPNYQKSGAEELLTGSAYQRNVTANPGTEESSADNLSNNGQYWIYDKQQVHKILDVQSIAPDEVNITAIVSENRVLHKTSGGIITTSSSNKDKSCYAFKKIDNRWKISGTPPSYKCP